MKDILNACSQVASANWALLALAVICVAGVGIATEFMLDEQQGYQDAAGEAARCQKMAQQILATRGPTPAIAKSEQRVTYDSAEIGSAASAANIATDNFDRIDHDGSQRVGSSPYVRWQTGISLKGVPLREIVVFLHELQAARVPLIAQSLRISPADPGGKQDDELWDAALSVVSIRYAPAVQGATVRSTAVGSAYP